MSPNCVTEPRRRGAEPPHGLIAVLPALETHPEQTSAVQQRVGVEHQLLDIHDDLDGLAGIARIGASLGGFGDLYGLVELLTERLQEVGDDGAPQKETPDTLPTTRKSSRSSAILWLICRVADHHM